MRGLEVLRRHRVEWNALVAVPAANQDRALEVYRFLRDECDARFIQFIPIVERPAPGGIPAGDRVSARSVGPEQWGRFLVQVFEEWVRRDIGEVYVQLFDAALANWHGEPPGLCVHAPTCGLQPALEHQGDLYTCDHFVEPAYRLGSITETPLRELVDSGGQRAFGRAKHDALPGECLGCEVAQTGKPFFVRGILDLALVTGLE